MTELERNNEYEDFKKRRLLKISVWAFSVIIALVWIASVRFSFANMSKGDNQSPLSLTKTSIKEDMENIIGVRQDRLQLEQQEKLKKAEEQAFLQAMSSDISEKAKVAADTESKEMLVELKKRLKKDENCPEYIDCMPTIGEAVDCVVPTGCENITQIAY